jgi:hypothetical protein
MAAALDIRTLSLAAAVVSLVLCAYLLSFQAARRTYPGFRLWTAGSLAMGAGMILLSLRGIIPAFLSILVANVLIVAELVLIRRGLADFAGQPARPWPDAAFLVLYAFLICWFTYFQPDTAARVVILSASFACYLAWSVQVAAGPVAKLLGARNRLLLASMAALAAFYALRVVLTLLGPPTPNDLLAPSRLVAATLIFSLAMHILIVNGLVMLNVQRLEMELTAAQGEVNLLSGLLPICSGCKRIRDEQGGWQPVESYISGHSEAEFTHGICPDCLRQRYPDLAEQVLNKNFLPPGRGGAGGVPPRP